MFGSSSISITVVFPKGYEEIAASMKHTISKLNDLDSTSWTLEQYIANRPTLSGKSYIVFLGGEQDNKISRPYLDHIEKLFYKDGGCFGIDGTVAVIFGMDKTAIREMALNKSKKHFNADGSEIDYAQLLNGFPEEEEYEVAFDGSLSETASSIKKGLFSKINKLSNKAGDFVSASSIRKNNTQNAIAMFIERGLPAWLKND